ncbi:MAG: acyltransferase 3 [Fibrobacteres bacterium]|nr:acyltransferase 3 [Fibrobacterota bacterium]
MNVELLDTRSPDAAKANALRTHPDPSFPHREAGVDWSPAGRAGTARPERQHHLDALRSILMVLGVFLHASYIYAGDAPWLVKDADTSRVLSWVNAFIHFFRIPCFFILSGFFAQMLLEKQGQGGFLKSRLSRLGLPLLSTAVLFNSVQSYLLHSAGSGSHDMGAHGMAGYFGSMAYGAFWTGGEWIGHLWFLVNVFLYSAVAVGLLALRKKWGPVIGKGFAHARLRHPASSRFLFERGGFMLLLPLGHFALFALAAFMPFLYRIWGGITGYSLLHFLGYYLAGLALFVSARLREEFHRVRPWQILSVPAAYALGQYLDSRTGARWAGAAVFYLNSYLVWSTCAMVFAAFRFLLNRRYRVFAYLSEASYSIYLFHHVCVVALGLYMTGKDWDVHLEFGLIVSVSLAFSLAVHHYLVLRVRALRLLFMGK